MSSDPLNFELRLQPRQWEVFFAPARFRVVVAGRRFGKTELALAEIVRAACLSENRTVWYIGPTRRQTKRVIWRRLKKATQPYWEGKPKESELQIDLRNGSTISVGGAFDPDGLRGDGVDFVVLDEVATMKPAAWEEAIRPTLSDRLGRALFIGTPKGRNHLHRYFELAKTDEQWQGFQFTTEQGGIVLKEELESAGRQMDENCFRQEYEAEFTSVGRYRAYSSFSRTLNVKELQFEVSEPLAWSIDFNVEPLCSLMMQKVGDDIHVLAEMAIRPSATTRRACEEFVRLGQPLGKIVPWTYQPLRVKVYGDASGNQRRTAGMGTDFVQIREFFKGWVGTFQPSMHYATANPLVRDRVNCVNARLCNRLGEPRLFIDPKCKGLIRDLEEVSWAVDSSGAAIYELDKRDKERTHLSDALGYFVSQVFPLKTPER